MKKEKFLFIDRDGTLIIEPEDQQVDGIEKLDFMPGVFNALSVLSKVGYQLIMVTNQDGLDTASYPLANFEQPHQLMLKIFKSQGIEFEKIHICPHVPNDNCQCRKPKVGLLLDYLKSQTIDLNHSYVIGDRETDLELASNLGINGIKIGCSPTENWAEITDFILKKPRIASTNRKTNETNIIIDLNLDQSGKIIIDTGIGFFNHMLEQLIKHAGVSAAIQVKGDLHIDDHHTVEDTAIALGEAFKTALHDKIGITRYGFVLPMDEAQAQIALDLSGRAYCHFDAKFTRESIGGLSTELITHFFRSFAEGLKATLHINIIGENNHHMAEAGFKAVGRSLRQAIIRENTELPSTKGIL